MIDSLHTCILNQKRNFRDTLMVDPDPTITIGQCKPGFV